MIGYRVLGHAMSAACAGSRDRIAFRYPFLDHTFGIHHFECETGMGIFPEDFGDDPLNFHAPVWVVKRCNGMVS